MKTSIIVSIIGVLLASGLFVAYWFKSSTTSPTEEFSATQAGQEVFPTANSITQNAISTYSPQDAVMTVVDAGGKAISTTNFIADPATVKDPINAGYYYLGYHVNEGVPDPTATDNPPYVIEYIAETNYFNIALLQEPIGEQRLAAEQYLMARLGITPDQMCRLDYMVSVPDRINSYYSGKNLGFSFCPGATALPQ